MAGRVTCGEKVRLYFSKEKRKNHGNCYRRTKNRQIGTFIVCVSRGEGEREERYIHNLKRGPRAKKRENF